MAQFLLGAITMLSLTIGIFFLHFWKKTADRFFLAFGVAFGIEALARILQASTDRPDDGRPLVYVIRFLAYALILAAIIDKNRPRKTGS
ncbi:MAG: hypothetical protein HYZ53_09845 [Planctomycetes bacterium]|nr:hypothetical protein [Planctomycetota bacterium]